MFPKMSNFASPPAEPGVYLLANYMDITFLPLGMFYAETSIRIFLNPFVNSKPRGNHLTHEDQKEEEAGRRT